MLFFWCQKTWIHIQKYSEKNFVTFQEILIFATAFLALSQAVPIDKDPNGKVASPVAVEVKEAVQESDDLQPEASAWGG